MPAAPTVYNINNANLKFYYPLDVNTLDYASGTGVSTASITNASISTATTALTSGSLSFTGSGYFQLPTTSFNANGVTLMLWMKTSTIYPPILFINTDGTFSFGFSSNTILIQVPGQRLINNDGSFDANVNSWHHYCFVINKTGEINTYIDARMKRYTDSSTTSQGYPGGQTYPVFTNKSIKVCSSTTSSPFNGQLNQVVIFNRVVTIQEIFYFAKYPASVVLSSAPTTTDYKPITQYVAVNNGRFGYSVDGIVWNKATGDILDSTYSAYNIWGVATNGSMWVGCSTNYGTYTAGYGTPNQYNIYYYIPGPFWYSFDGNTWSPCSFNAFKLFDAYAYSIAYGNGIWVAGGNPKSGVPSIAYSYDGIYWTSGSGITAEVRSVVYLNSTWVAGGDGLYYSSDGINWTKNTQGYGFIGITANSAGMWVAVGYSPNNIMYSNNLTGAWSVASSVGSTFGAGKAATAVAWNGSKFLVVGEIGKLLSSSDGINWTVSTPALLGEARSIVWTGSLWMIGQYDGNGTRPCIITSADGTNWSGVSSATTAFTAGARLTAISAIVSNYTYPCFKQGTRILALNPETKEAEYIPVERLRKGDLVKTYARGFIPIHTIGHTVLKNPKNDTKKDNRLYRFTPDDCPELEEDLCITGNHCVLWQRISDKKRQQVEEHMGKVYITEGKYRVPAFLDDRAKPYDEEGPATIWHFALENSNRYDNYGVLANGLLVESSSIRYMTELSNMELV